MSALNCSELCGDFFGNRSNNGQVIEYGSIPEGFDVQGRRTRTRGVQVDFLLLEKEFKNRVIESVGSEDPAHDLDHFSRVVRQAKSLAEEESASLEIVIPAAWLHDLVNVPKNDSRRNLASTLSADAAIEYLKELKYPTQYFDGIYHAIQAHSFSAGFVTKTLEAQVVQDADRLDALGAIGVARCFSIAGQLGRPYYNLLDPFCQERLPDDSKYTLDHFFIKLLKLADTFQTLSGKQEAEKRTQFMLRFLEQFQTEIQ